MNIKDIVRELCFIQDQYSMPFYRKNYKEYHKIYEQYQMITNKMIKKIFDLENELKQLKEEHK